MLGRYINFRNSSVLEPGCGMGIALCYLSQLGSMTIGLDLSRETITHAKYMRKQYKISPKVMELYNCDFFKYKLSRKFDLVFNSGVVEHYDQDKQIMFVNKMKQLSNNMVCLIQPNLSSPAFKALVKKMHNQNRKYDGKHYSLDIEKIFKKLGILLLDIDGIELFQTNYSTLKNKNLHKIYLKYFSKFIGKHITFNKNILMEISKVEGKIDKKDRIRYGFSTVYVGRIN